MSQKMENQLNLALETPVEIREQTQDLNTGFDAGERTWELIVKYNGSLEDLEQLGVAVETLLSGYAILTVPESLVEQIAADPSLEYVEKPKNYYYTPEGPSERVCIAAVTAREPFLRGTGVLIAVLDSGISWQRREFLNENGSTRIRFFWDQTLQQAEDLPGPPNGFREGVEFDQNYINQALGQRARIPSLDVSGHGTAVAGIAAASYTEGYQGVAPGAELLIVKLGGNGGLAGFSQTTHIMRAVTWALQKSRELGMPLVINLSFGNTYGPHDGSSLLERFLDNAAEVGRTVICAGSGNEGSAGGHVQGILSGRKEVALAVGERERSLNVQIWKSFVDSFRIRLRAPGGSVVELTQQGGAYQLEVENTRLLVWYGQPTPYSTSQEIYIEMLPGDAFLKSGIWTFLLEPVRIVSGQYSFYLPSSITLSTATRFLEPSPWNTLTVPSTAGKVITVGAFDPVTLSYADFSGRGWETGGGGARLPSGIVRPDVVAPGVNLVAPDSYGGYVSASGTSFSTPIVSGSAALLMEWGIIRGNDTYLYGEKMKAYLQAGAQPLRGEDTLPSQRVGYGAVCVAASLPREVFG